MCRTNNYKFAVALALIFVWSTSRRFWQRGSITSLHNEVLISFKYGLLTDVLRHVMKDDKIHDTFLSLHVLYYSAPYVLNSPFAMMSVGVSFLLGLRSLTNMVFVENHLGVDAVAFDDKFNSNSYNLARVGPVTPDMATPTPAHQSN